jgi:hypothetical protein
MTEAQWLRCDEPGPMLAPLRDSEGWRKLRLFRVACCRRIWSLLVDPHSRAAVEAAERFADGASGAAELRAAADLALKAANTLGVGAARAHDPGHAFWVAAQVAHGATGGPLTSLGVANHAAVAAGAAAYRVGGGLAAERAARSAEQAAQCRLLRDLLGNPFEAVLSADAAWLVRDGAAARNLAEAIYEERAFDRLPILADALEDAGCADAAVLGHCRGGGEHVRGCWVVDLLLGKR